MSRIFAYCRISTLDQTTENQRRESERQNQRRLAYASEVYRIYTGIKSSKGIRLPATKKSLPEINSVQNN